MHSRSWPSPGISCISPPSASSLHPSSSERPPAPPPSELRHQGVAQVRAERDSPIRQCDAATLTAAVVFHLHVLNKGVPLQHLVVQLSDLVPKEDSSFSDADPANHI